MAEHPHSPPPSGENSGEHSSEHPEHHEHSDVSIRGLSIFFAIFIVFGIATHVMLYFVYWGYDSIEEKQKTPQSAIEQQRPIEPTVPLQGVPGLHAQSPAQDTLDYINRQEIVLRNYGPTTRPGVGRIPIARAMDLVIERNLLKARTAAVKDPESNQP